MEHSMELANEHPYYIKYWAKYREFEILANIGNLTICEAISFDISRMHFFIINRQIRRDFIKRHGIEALRYPNFSKSRVLA